MAMAKKSTKPKRGPLELSRIAGLACQQVQRHRSPVVTLEIRTFAGDVLHGCELPEPVAHHQLLPDGHSVLLVDTVGISDDRTLRHEVRMLDARTQEIRPLAATDSLRIAASADRFACVRDGAVCVHGLSGEQLSEARCALDPEHHALAFMPNGDLAVSTGAHGAECVVDLLVLDGETGKTRQEYRAPCASSYGHFAPAGVHVAPHGNLVAITGFHAGLAVFDLASAEPAADRFAPHPLDLADGRTTLHDHHTYGDIAFDRDGLRMAAAYRPGWVSAWRLDGTPLLQAAPFVNPKAKYAIAFDGDGLLYMDSFGDRAQLAL